MQLTDHLRSLDYPGRGVLLGALGESLVGIYFVTARSESSKAKRYVLSGDQKTISVKTTNLKIMARGKLDLLQYTAVRMGETGFAIGNGRQVDAVELVSEVSAMDRLTQDLAGWSYEDDAYHTPRITGLVSVGSGALSAGLHIIRSNEIGSVIRNGYSFTPAPQTAALITTYRGENVRPTPAFQGEPIQLLFSEDSLATLTQAVYDALAPKAGKEDLRVCTIGVAFDPKTKHYETAILNAVSEA